MCESRSHSRPGKDLIPLQFRLLFNSRRNSGLTRLGCKFAPLHLRRTVQVAFPKQGTAPPSSLRLPPSRKAWGLFQRCGYSNPPSRWLYLALCWLKFSPASFVWEIFASLRTSASCFRIGIDCSGPQGSISSNHM